MFLVPVRTIRVTCQPALALEKEQTGCFDMLVAHRAPHHMDGVIWTASSLLPSPATVTTGESQGNRPFRLFSVGCALSRTTLTEILS